MATKETELPTLTSPGATAVAPEPDDVEYPEGHWTAPSVWHGDAVRQAASALDYCFRDRTDVLVAMELVVYYQRGNNKAWLQPEVQVVFGVEHCGNLGSFRVWEEGKAPDFVLEVVSASTAESDARHKAREYTQIGVIEYWRLDPTGSLTSSPLEGYSAYAGSYDAVEPVANRGQWLRSEVLGLELRSERQAGATVVVFRDPETGEEFDGRLEAAKRPGQSVEREEQILEQEISAAEQRVRVAEERVRALEERLRAPTAQAPPPERDP